MLISDWSADVCSSDLGRLDPAKAEAVLDSIRIAVALARRGEAAAVVTNPIHKQVLMEAGFHHPGHTEFLAELSAAERARSEEHTSELQSLMRISYAVFCLKNIQPTKYHTHLPIYTTSPTHISF